MGGNTIINILTYLKEERGFDFSGYRTPILERRIQKRLISNSLQTFEKYYDFLIQDKEEPDKLFDVLALNVSHFFRNALTFEYLRKIILPELISEKIKQKNKSIRIWSAGSSNGEEPYSIAILFNEILNNKETHFHLNIFATDIDKKALSDAEAGRYKNYHLDNVKFSYLNKYFTEDAGGYILNKEIRKMVNFHFFDLVAGKGDVPQESIFGGFDIVLCRNVLIYFEANHQKIIFNKLYKSLNNNGYLILGESETPVEEFKSKFRNETNICKIYRKNG